MTKMFGIDSHFIFQVDLIPLCVQWRWWLLLIIGEPPSFQSHLLLDSRSRLHLIFQLLPPFSNHIYMYIYIFIPLIPFPVCSSSSALPLLVMDSCWTSTNASAGKDSTIQTEWRSMAIKVSCKSVCDIKIHCAASCQIKTLKKLLKLREALFLLKFSSCLWGRFLGLEGLWNFSDCCFPAPVSCRWHLSCIIIIRLLAINTLLYCWTDYQSQSDISEH